MTLPLELTFMDSTNKEYTQTKDIVLNVKNLNGNNGSEKGATGYFIIFAIVAIGLGIYFWRRKKQKKQKR